MKCELCGVETDDYGDVNGAAVCHDCTQEALDDQGLVDNGIDGFGRKESQPPTVPTACPNTVFRLMQGDDYDGLAGASDGSYLFEVDLDNGGAAVVFHPDECGVSGLWYDDAATQEHHREFRSPAVAAEVAKTLALLLGEHSSPNHLMAVMVGGDYAP